jgi:DNA repair protein RadD
MSGLQGQPDRAREGVTVNEQAGFFDSPSARRFPTPRPFQDVAHRELRAGFMQGHVRQVLMAPTGAGKSYIGLRLCAEAIARGKRVVFICDRKTLINQTSAVADAYGMPPHGIFQADHHRFAPTRPFQIASAQTIAARGLNDTFDVVVVDEAHTLYKPVTDLVMETKAAVVGLSATPFTKGLGKVYSRVINAATMHELTEQKILAPLRVLSCVRIDMAGAKTSGGEWTNKAAEERGLAIVGDVVLEWMKHAEDRKTIVFGPTVVHCEELVRQFKAAGVNARTFCGTTPDAERAELLEEYRKPDSKIRVLVSVEALAKGFDVPDVGCVVDCRPLRKSLSTFVQMIGRGLRGSPGKDECLLLDHSGNVVRFRDDFSDIYFNGLTELDAGEKLDKTIREDDSPEAAAKPCPKCGASPMGRRCVRCGFEPVRVSAVEHLSGSAEEIDPLFNVKKYAPSKRELFNAIATYKRNTAKPGGNPKGATAHAYRDITGSWPPPSFEYHTAPVADVPDALIKKLKSRMIAFAKSRRVA